MHEELRGEMYLYHLLRQLFLAEPTRELIREIGAFESPRGDGSMAAGMRLMTEAARRNASRVEDWLEDLRVEYSRIFLGPLQPMAVPYASFYLSGSRQLMTEETIDIRRRYLEAGIALKELYRIPDDHIGIELEFLFYLTEEILALYERDQVEHAARLEELRSDFVTNHMARWVPEFAQQVANSIPDDLYKGAALLLADLIRNQQA